MQLTSPQIETAVIAVPLSIAAGAVAMLASTGGSWPLIVLATIPFVVRAAWRSMPLWLLLLSTTVPIMIAEVIENQPTSATWLIGCVALVVAAIDRSLRIEWLPIALTIGGPVWLSALGAVEGPGAILGIWVMGLLLSATIGTIVGQQRRLILTMSQAQASVAHAAATEERHRIARDLHDIVGHSFSVVLLHLAGARHLMSTDHVRAEAALRQAEDVGRQSMDELRASLALLRSTDRSYTPVGDLEALSGLIDGVRRAGLDVTYRVSGDLERVDMVVGVVIHSVAREALTNAAKHAAAGPVTCEIAVDEQVSLRVTNRVRTDAAPTANAASGHGLADMTERVSAVGGSLRVIEADGNWTVVLDAPVRSSRSSRSSR